MVYDCKGRNSFELMFIIAEEFFHVLYNRKIGITLHSEIRKKF